MVSRWNTSKIYKENVIWIIKRTDFINNKESLFFCRFKGKMNISDFLFKLQLDWVWILPNRIILEKWKNWKIKKHQKDNFSYTIKKHQESKTLGITGCGGWTRTIDLRVMSPASCQLLHPAMYMDLFNHVVYYSMDNNVVSILWRYFLLVFGGWVEF